MCWSLQASFSFALLDLSIVAALLRRRTYADGSYAAILSAIAGQEICQMVLWKLGTPASSSCSPTESFLSFMAVQFAMLVPAAGLLRSPGSTSQKRTIRFWGWMLWLLYVAITWASVISKKKLCVELGDNHHMIWICDQAYYEVGGYFMYISSMFLYLVVGCLAIIAMELPGNETYHMLTIGIGSWVACFVLYYRTLEACSVWCWSALTVGVYAWLRPTHLKYN